MADNETEKAAQQKGLELELFSPHAAKTLEVIKATMRGDLLAAAKLLGDETPISLQKMFPMFSIPADNPVDQWNSQQLNDARKAVATGDQATALREETKLFDLQATTEGLAKLNIEGGGYDVSKIPAFAAFAGPQGAQDLAYLNKANVKMAQDYGRASEEQQRYDGYNQYQAGEALNRDLEAGLKTALGGMQPPQAHLVPQAYHPGQAKAGAELLVRIERETQPPQPDAIQISMTDVQSPHELQPPQAKLPEKSAEKTAKIPSGNRLG